MAKSLFALKREGSSTPAFEVSVDAGAVTVEVEGNAILAEQQSAIADLNQDISATYVEAEVQAISDKVDAILAALRAHGLIAT